MSLFSRIRQLDAYTKPMEDFRVKTMTGGFGKQNQFVLWCSVTLLATITIIALSISETRSFLSPNIVEQLYVDSTSSDIRVDVNFDLTFPRLSCQFITIDVMDISSENQDNIKDDIYKLPLDLNGNNLTETVQKLEVNQNKTASNEVAATTPKCGSCYGALPEGNCCNTCDEVKEAYQIKGWQVNMDEVEQCKSDRWVRLYADHKNEGCRVYGKVQVAKVAGNFHLAPGDPFRTMRTHVHDLHSLDPFKFDTSHVINHFSFGTPFPGKKYPVDGKKLEGKGGIMYSYYVKVVPTSYVYTDGRKDNSHQFSITTSQKDLSQGMSGLPGFFVQYEFSPLMVRFEERNQPLITFLVSLCAIVGGIFTVAQLIDTLLYQSSRLVRQKLNMNKLG